METLHMQDVIRLVGLPAPPAGKSSYYIPCPCCDDKPKSRHLNINLQKKCVSLPPVRLFWRCAGFVRCLRGSAPGGSVQGTCRKNGLSVLGS